MAQDGSLPPEWKGQAFPYLPHHPKQPAQTFSYRDARPEIVAAQAELNRGNVGTWDGPAPRGQSAEEAARASSGARTTTSDRQPDSTLLPGGGKLPLLGFGTYKVESSDVIRTAVEAGYRHFDAALVYKNEKVVGEGLKDFIAREGREKLFITSKVWNDEHRPEAVRKSCKQSLADLGCEYLDLYLMHWPDAWLPGTQEPDTEVTIQQTWEAMEQLVDDGLVKALGVANFSLPQVEELLEKSRVKPVVNQVELHPLLAQRKLVGTCLRKGVTSVAYSPLGHGSSVLFDLPEVKELAEEVGRTPAQVLLRWNVQRGVGVIPRSQSTKNIKDNIEGLFDWALTPEQKAKLDTLDRGFRTVTNDWHKFD